MSRNSSSFSLSPPKKRRCSFSLSLFPICCQSASVAPNPVSDTLSDCFSREGVSRSAPLLGVTVRRSRSPLLFFPSALLNTRLSVRGASADNSRHAAVAARARAFARGAVLFIFSARGAGAAAGAAAGPTLPPARARALTADTPVLFDAPADGPGGAAAGAGAGAGALR